MFGKHKCRDCRVCTRPSVASALLGPMAFVVTIPLALLRGVLGMLTPGVFRIKDKLKRKCPDCGHNLDDHVLDQRGQARA